MLHLDLFSGIGGFALAARNVGWQTIGFCEIDPYCQKVLKKHWPEVPIYDDIKTYTGTAGDADIITAGFPCQDISHAGKQAGIEGERSGLWTELARVIGEVRPRYAVLENVAALLSGDKGRWFQRVLGDLAEVGYDCEWHCIPASHVGAPHRRDRVWILAYPCGTVRADAGTQSRTETEPTLLQQENGETLPGDARPIRGDVADTDSKRLEGVRPNGYPQGWQGPLLGPSGLRHGANTTSQQWATEPTVCGMVDGISTGLDGYRGRVADKIPDRTNRLRGLGNAIVPQVAQVIFEGINEMR